MRMRCDRNLPMTNDSRAGEAAAPTIHSHQYTLGIATAHGGPSFAPTPVHL